MTTNHVAATSEIAPVPALLRGYRAGLACLALCASLAVCAAEFSVEPVIPSVLMVVSAVAAGLSLLRVRRDDRGLLPKWMVSFAALAVFCLAFAEVYVWGQATVLALSHFFVAVVVLKLVDRTTVRDDAELLVTSLFLLVIGAITSGQVLFGVLLLFFVFVGLRTLVKFHFRGEEDRLATLARSPGDAAGRPRVFVATAAPPGATAGATSGIEWRAMGMIIACGAMIFLLCPRVGPTLFNRAATPIATSLTGFTDALRFGDLNEIKKNQRVVMRVEMLENGESVGSPNVEPYFRGVALDAYSGRDWWTADPGANVDRPASGERLLYGYEPDARDRVIEQRYTLLNPATRYLFACYVPYRVDFEDHYSLLHRRADRALWSASGRLPGPVTYSIRSLTRMTPRLAEALRENVRREQPMAERWPLQRPERRRPPDIHSVVSAEVQNYTNEVVRGLPPPTDGESIRAIARRIEAHLTSGRFSYTLDRSDVTRWREPVEDFLLHRRRGHCEYFASAMAVMCQLAGLKARVVNGYRGGQWNATGGYYVVTEQDAHSWVEVYSDDNDWETYDPTPGSVNVRRDADSLWSTIDGIFGHLQVLWADKIVSYTAANREVLLAQFGQWLAELGKQQGLWEQIVYAAKELLLGPAALSLGYRLMYWVVILLCLIAAYMGLRLAVRPGKLWWRWLQRITARAQPRSRSEGFYARALDMLAVLGYPKPDTQTPLEHMRDVAARDARFAAAAEIAQAYYHVHYGAHDLDAGQRARLDRIMADIARQTQRT